MSWQDDILSCVAFLLTDLINMVELPPMEADLVLRHRLIWLQRYSNGFLFSVGGPVPVNIDRIFVAQALSIAVGLAILRQPMSLTLISRRKLFDKSG